MATLFQDTFLGVYESLHLTFDIIKNMSEKIPTNENRVERILSEREVLNEFDEIIGGDYEIFISHEDENGIYRLEVRTKDEAGDIVQYNYVRRGSYPDGFFSNETVIDVAFSMGDMPVGGHPIKKYKEGVWVPEVD